MTFYLSPIPAFGPAFSHHVSERIPPEGSVTLLLSLLVIVIISFAYMIWAILRVPRV